MTIQEIQLQVCADYGVTLLDLVSRRRGRGIVQPRQVAMWLARHGTVASLSEIGKAFGGRDHTTVMHALERVDGQMARDPVFWARVQQLRGEAA